jgi:hypothetical protein
MTEKKKKPAKNTAIQKYSNHAIQQSVRKRKEKPPNSKGSDKTSLSDEDNPDIIFKDGRRYNLSGIRKTQIKKGEIRNKYGKTNVEKARLTKRLNKMLLSRQFTIPGNSKSSKPIKACAAEALVYKLLNEGMGGDINAIKLIFDRIEGKNLTVVTDEDDEGNETKHFLFDDL